MIDLNLDFVVTNHGDMWTVEQLYCIHPGDLWYDEETDTLTETKPRHGFRTVHEFGADTEAEAAKVARQWLRDMRERVIRHVFLNEAADDQYFTGGWDQNAGQWIRPLDPETKRLTGCYAEFSRQPFGALSYEDAIKDVLERYGLEAIDRQLVRRISTNEAVGTYDIAQSSVTLACRSGDIAYASKRGRDWTFPTWALLAWLDGRPGSGRQAAQAAPLPGRFPGPERGEINMAVKYSEEKLASMTPAEVSRLLKEVEATCQGFVFTFETTGDVDDEAADEWFEYRDLLRVITE
jgi:hypothetical protein